MIETAGAGDGDPLDTISRLQRRLERERQARRQAEVLLEEKSRELYMLNRELSLLADDLENRVIERTGELDAERQRALVLAGQDQLTGLANRRRFTALLDEACQRAADGGPPVTLLLLDIDNFRTINETAGNEAGDSVLLRVAQGLARAAGENGHAARLDGDEFALLLYGQSDTGAVARELSHTLREQITVRGRTLDVSCSAGVATAPLDTHVALELQRFAGLALTASREAGRARVTVFDDEIRRRVEDRLVLELELRAAVSTGQIIPWFQPVVDAAQGRVAGAEVLARWNHPLRGIVPPAGFLPVIEELGLMTPMFRSIMTSACTLGAPHVRAGRIDYLSLNVSPEQFLEGSVATVVAEILEATGYPAPALVIEITEEVLMGDTCFFGRELGQLAAMGVRIALDDFGTGYSNIALLRHLPIDWLKLDRSLARDLPESVAGKAIVQAIVQMCQALNLEIVAEGVENEAQSHWLVAQGCQRLQGFYYGRPVPWDDFIKN